MTEISGSSTIAAVGRDAERGVLIVRFLGGAVYEYVDVPEEKHAGMLAADSAGSYLAREIKGQHLYRRVA